MIDIDKIKRRKQLFEDLLYHPLKNGIRKVKETVSIQDRIIYFEIIFTLSQILKQNEKN